MIPISKIKNSKLLGPLYCISAAVIWGLSFVVQSDSASKITTLTFTFLRLILGGTSLLPVILLQNRKKNPTEKAAQKSNRKVTVIGGICCGIALATGLILQQTAFAYGLEAGKVGFITALYMILVPLLGLFLGKRPKMNVWLGVALGAVGLYLICVKTGAFSVGVGEWYTLAGALAFAVHILCLDHFTAKTDAIVLSCVQFYVAAVIAGVLMVIFEEPTVAMVKSAWPAVLYAGIMSSGVAFTLQALGQQKTEPAVASLLLCLESAFSLLFGWLILHQLLETRAMIGCGIMLTAVILTQIQPKSKAKGI